MEIEMGEHFCGWSPIFENLFKDLYLQAAEIMPGFEDISGVDRLKQHYKL